METSSVTSIWCERQTTSFTKAFKKRYVTFDEETRKLWYSEDERKAPKGTMILTKVVLCCQVMEVKSSDLFTMMVDGNEEDGRAVQWTFRFPTRSALEQWNELLWNSCASAGLMEPLNYGLPPLDPRTQLPFVHVPLEHLFKFAFLEKAVIHFFSPVTVLLPPGRSGHSVAVEHVLVVGDRAVYIFKMSVDVVSCTAISHIRKIHHGPDATFFAIQVRPPAPDIVVRDFAEGVQLASVLSRLYEVTTNKRLGVLPINVPTADVLVESQQLRLAPGEGYKLQVISPTSKVLLCQALDAAREEAKNNNQDGSGTNGGADAAGALDLLKNGDSGALDGTDPLAKLLQSIGLSQYTTTLRSQHVDLDVIRCMDATDLMTFGVADEGHCKLILDAALSSDMANLPVNATNAMFTGEKGEIGGGGGITLEDDDDDDLENIMMAPRNPSKPVELDDDSDDDILLPKSAEKKVPIVFDDDDDL